MCMGNACRWNLEQQDFGLFGPDWAVNCVALSSIPPGGTWQPRRRRARRVRNGGDEKAESNSSNYTETTILGFPAAC